MSAPVKPRTKEEAIAAAARVINAINASRRRSS